MHAPVGHPRQDTVGLFFDFRNGRLDDHGLYAASTERICQVTVDALFAAQGILPRQALALFALQERTVVEFALRKHALIACFITRPMRFDRLHSHLIQPGPFRW